MDRRGLERLVETQRRQHAAQSPREHRLPRTRRADEQQVMAARRGNLRAPGGPAAGRGRPQGPAPRFTGAAAAVGCGTLAQEGSFNARDGVDETAHRQHAKSRDNRGLAGIGRRQEKTLQAVASRRDRDRQDAAGRMNRAVERELADEHQVGELYVARRRRTPRECRARSAGRTMRRPCAHPPARG